MQQSQQQVEKSIASMAGGLSSLGAIAGPLVAVAAVGAVATAVTNTANAVVDAAGHWVNAAREQERAERKLQAVIKSTGGIAGLTAAEIKRYSGELQRLTNFDDSITTNAAAVLATFTRVRGSVFTEALSRAQDLATVFDTDLKSAILQVGKALNDPISGMTALRRSGVSFTEEQREQVKLLQQQGDLLGAQRIILDELQTEFGGAAQAMADPLIQAENLIGDIKEVLGFALLPAVNEIARDFIGWVGDLDRARARAEALGLVIKAMVQDAQDFVGVWSRFDPLMRLISSEFADFMDDLDKIAEMQAMMKPFLEKPVPAAPLIDTSNLDEIQAAGEAFQKVMDELARQQRLLTTTEPGLVKLENELIAISERLKLNGNQAYALWLQMLKIDELERGQKEQEAMKRKAEQEQQALQRQADSIVRSLMTPFDKFEESVNQLLALRSGGFLTEQQVTLGLEQANTRLETELKSQQPQQLQTFDVGLSQDQKDIMRLLGGVGAGDPKAEEKEIVQNTKQAAEQMKRAADLLDRARQDNRNAPQVQIKNIAGS
jgi:hypothetical protein